MTRPVRISTTDRFNPMIVLTDLVDGAKRVHLWLAFASDEIQNRYRRSKLGLAWIVLSYLIFVATISIFFGTFSDLDHNRFTIYVAINFAIFTFLLGNITDGCAVFRVARTWISSVPLPHSTHIYKSIARSLFVFTINMIVAMTIFFLYGYKLELVAWEAIPAFLLLLVDAVFVQMILGYITARFRDIEHLIQSITRILFFTTPVLWVRDEHVSRGMRSTVSELNPMTHALEIFSAPILGRHADPHSWMFILYMSVALFVIALVVGGYSHRRLPYWL
ncbi:ABC transporter permease [Hyphomonas jannaschiana]|uniref:ABC transporter n=1 Tax=Hyphomonas jannaschiana VP2 TaxID=1280952 RepID=A0A059FF89_9PROT|nr:ABC transporter permease [Hyphomonas jannaschiana]KCZ89267.1 ABC transporter [Hyphomonas jannaschiana VP2]